MKMMNFDFRVVVRLKSYNISNKILFWTLCFILCYFFLHIYFHLDDFFGLAKVSVHLGFLVHIYNIDRSK